VMAGFGVRLVAYVIVLGLLESVAQLDRAVLALTTALLLFATTTYEAWTVSRDPSFSWVNTGAIERNGA